MPFVYAAQSTITREVWRKDGGMNRDAYLSSLRTSGEGLLAAAGAADLAWPVPSCPGWDVHRLVGHVGRVYRFTAGWVTEGHGDTPIDRPPAGAAVLDWARDGLAIVEEALTGAEESGLVRTWTGDRPPMFWPLRMAIETALHRWDAEAALELASQPGIAPTPVDSELAVEGIDELLTVLVPFRAADALTGAGETIHLHATDAEGEWVLTLRPSGPPQVEHAHAKGDVAARGPASDLLLFLNNRVPTGQLQVFGDTALLDRWTTSVKL
jgi:uncharacterized protein (TIGR03083 family)